MKTGLKCKLDVSVRNKDEQRVCEAVVSPPRRPSEGLTRGAEGELRATGAEQLVAWPRRPSEGLTRGTEGELSATGAEQLVAWGEVRAGGGGKGGKGMR